MVFSIISGSSKPCFRRNRLLTSQKKCRLARFRTGPTISATCLKGGKKYTFRSGGNFNRRFFVFSNKIFFFPLDRSARKNMFYHRGHRTVSLQLYPERSYIFTNKSVFSTCEIIVIKISFSSANRTKNCIFVRRQKKLVSYPRIELSVRMGYKTFILLTPMFERSHRSTSFTTSSI